MLTFVCFTMMMMIAMMCKLMIELLRTQRLDAPRPWPRNRLDGPCTSPLGLRSHFVHGVPFEVSTGRGDPEDTNQGGVPATQDSTPRTTHSTRSVCVTRLQECARVTSTKLKT